MERFRHIVIPGYLLAAMFIILPLVDTLVGVWPIRLSEVSWRFGVAGLYAQVLSSVMLGLTLILVVSLIAESRVVSKALAATAGVAALAMAVASVMFVLDAMQMRAQVNPQALRGFDMASALALFKYGLAATVASVLAFAGWRAGQASSRPVATRSAAPLVRGAPRTEGTPVGG